MTAELGAAATLAQTRQSLSISMLKKAAESQAAVANLVAQAAENVPVSSSRGTSVNISA